MVQGIYTELCQQRSHSVFVVHNLVPFITGTHMKIIQLSSLFFLLQWSNSPRWALASSTFHLQTFLSPASPLHPAIFSSNKQTLLVLSSHLSWSFHRSSCMKFFHSAFLFFYILYYLFGLCDQPIVIFGI